MTHLECVSPAAHLPSTASDVYVHDRLTMWHIPQYGRTAERGCQLLHSAVRPTCLCRVAGGHVAAATGMHACVYFAS